MSFFRRFFAAPTNVEQINAAVERKRWAEALNLSAGINRSLLDASQLESLENNLSVAGDALAAMNLAEGEALARQGDRQRAQEHLQLARAQVRSQSLSEEIDEALSRFTDERLTVLPTVLSSTACSSGCCPSPEEVSVTSSSEMDMETRLDLILAGFPEAYAKRYLTLPPPLIEAVLLAHEGYLDEALLHFSGIDRALQCDTFFFERGSLLARNQKPDQAIADLQEALRLNPQHLLALESMIDVLMANGDSAAARNLIDSAAGEKLNASFRQARLARLCIMQSNATQALHHAQQAIDCGSRDSDNLELAAFLYEQNHEVARAEQVLLLLGGGGCSGGVNLPLAEFRFRHGRDLSKALETYKSLSRIEPANAAWLLRVGQIYLRMGWLKEGNAILDTLASSDLVGEEIQKIAAQERRQ